MAFGDSVIHPHLTKEREALLADKTVDTSGNVHWGQQTFSPADYAKFTAAQTDLGVSEKQLAILHAVHDGKPIPGSEEHVSPHGTTAQQLVDSATYDKDGTMHIGKLEIDKTLAGDFKKVLLEGKPDPEFAAMVEKASQTGHKIVRDDSADSHADGGDVTWDPSHGFTDYHNSANVSPGRVLKHELSHALRDPETQRVAMAIPDGTNTNVEERMAIECENRHADPHEMGRHSHESNAPKTMDPNHAPQVSDKAELAVKTRDIEKGVLWDTEGKWALKGAGTSFRGTVGDLHSENGQATIDIANGKHVKQIQFGETTSQVEGDAQHKSPLAVATEGVQKGDTISLSISRDGNSCTCKDFTRGTEVTVDRQGEVLNSRSFDPAKELAVPAR